MSLQNEMSKDELFREIATLRKDVERLKMEKADLEVLIETNLEHSDSIEEDLLLRIEATLRESEKRFRMISETIPVPIIVSRVSDNTIFYANEPAANLFGYPIAELMQKKTVALSDAIAGRNVMNILSAKGVVTDFELKGYKRDQTPFWVILSIQPLSFSDEPCLLAVLYDISDRKRAEKEKARLEEQLQQVQKMEAIGTLAGGIAHDFNNILSGILGFTQLTQMNLDSDNFSRAKKDLNEVLAGVDRAKDLVRQILAFSRQTDHGKQLLRIGPVFKEALKLLRAVIPVTINIFESIETKSDTVFADPTQIHQVLMNLCTNAAHSMRDTGGILEVTLRNHRIREVSRIHPDLVPGEYICIMVKDTGPGIDPAVRDRIFDPFFTTKKPGEGTGMGLSVVHGIVKSYGGAVFLESGPDPGSTFLVYLPKADTGLLEIQERGEPPLCRGKERILFVDDEPATVNSFQRMLAHLGYQVTACTNSVQALSIFNDRPDGFDLVITDHTMPNLTGEELAREIMKIRKKIPCILCTGYTDRMNREKAMAEGFKRFFLKPVDIRELSESIREIFSESDQKIKPN